MNIRYLGFVLLVWFPGALHAQSSAQPCPAPILDGGYFADETKGSFLHDEQLIYACEEGFKPALEGWWAISTCKNGTWIPKPQCLREEICFAPTIPNAKYTENQNGLYDNKDTISITCDDGYEPRDQDVIATCSNGMWSSVSVCERSEHACDAPPRIPHATIVNHTYQELFAVNTQLQYECEDGYATEGAGNQTTVCTNGSWTQGPPCRSDSGPLITNTDKCGEAPTVDHSTVLKERMFLKYKCDSGYTLKGLDTVACYGREWSHLPTCEVTLVEC